MSISSRKEKTYGVLHTEYYFYFYGFAKKINSEEIQKVDVYLDNQVIDTITANQCLKDIEDKYDIDDYSFTYKLPEKYIGGKHIISFKNNKDNKELEGSPYKLIDKSNIRFEKIQNNLESQLNQLAFLNSLNTFNSKKIKNIYSPNSIGFLAINENLEDPEFIEYLNQLLIKFPKTTITGFCYTKIIKKNPFNQKNCTFEQINHIKQINTQFFIFNAMENYEKLSKKEKDKNILLLNYLKNTSILPLQSNYNLKGKSIREQGYILFKLYENLFFQSFSEETIRKYDNNFYLILFQYFFDKNKINEKINIHQNALDFAKFKRLDYFLKYPSLFKEIKEFELKR